jgi:predicted nuclease of predicted toxin-antitoxin system
MKLLLDMGVSPRTAQYLRALGHDAIHLAERGLMKLADEEIMRLAESEGRAVVTFDLDFSRILAVQRLTQPSVILFRLELFTTDQVNTMLADLLVQHLAASQAGASGPACQQWNLALSREIAEPNLEVTEVSKERKTSNAENSDLCRLARLAGDEASLPA